MTMRSISLLAHQSHCLNLESASYGQFCLVAARIRSGLPRYRRLTDAEILAQSFRLGDAQELVARQHGFESWQALKQGLPTMSDHADTIPTKAVIAAAEPQLFVADIKSSCAFFTGKLGFAVVFIYGEPPFYAQVKRDGALGRKGFYRQGSGRQSAAVRGAGGVAAAGNVVLSLTQRPRVSLRHARAKAPPGPRKRGPMTGSARVRAGCPGHLRLACVVE